MKKTLLLFFIFSFIILSTCFAQTSYTWNCANGAWTLASNWTPERTSPAASDILVFDGSIQSTPTVTGLATETIGQIVVKNNATVDLSSTAAVTITIGGGTDTDFDIQTGSELRLTGSFAVTIKIAAGATGTIAGTFRCPGTTKAAHVLNPIDAGSLIVTGSVIQGNVTGTNFTGNLFGSSGTNGVVIFQSGSSFYQRQGSNPFGSSGAGRVTFQSGSNYYYYLGGAPSLSGRKYANLIFGNGQAPSSTSSMSGDCYIENLTLETGSSLVINNTGAGKLNISGNILQSTNITGMTLGAGGGVNLNGTIPQTISGLGSKTVTFTAPVIVSNPTSVTFNRTATFSGNITVNNGSSLITSSALTCNGTSNTINGTFTLNQGGSVTGTNFTYTDGSTLVMNGTSKQNLSSGSYNNLTINNSANVELSNNITVNGNLIISNGKLTTGSNTLTLGPSATLTESAGKFVLGNLQTTRSIGSGASSDFGGAGITLGAAAEDLGNVTLTRVTGSPVTLNSKNSISRIWKLNPANPLTLSRDMTISWLSDDDNSLTLTNLLTWQSTDDFATIDNVAPVGPSGDASTTRSLTVPLNALTSGANTSFSVFQADSPLPVELNTFTSAVKNNSVTLLWSTATEKSNYGFNVERSIDKTNWVKIGFVNGNGNSNSVKNYSFADKSTNSGKMYYRLKQVDTDGKYEYSKTIEADLGSPKAYELSNNYPNPFNPSTTIRFSLPEKQNVKITVFNTLGQKVAEILNGEMEAGVHEVNFNASNLTSGIYIYTMNAGKFTQTKKMMLVK